MDIFVGMKPWHEGDNGTVVLTNEPHSINIQDHAVVEVITLSEIDAAKDLIFRCREHTYISKEDQGESERVFELLFHNVSNIGITPEDFLPYKGSYLTTSFSYAFDQDKDKALVKWEGHNTSGDPNPTIEFHASQIEFKLLRKLKAPAFIGLDPLPVTDPFDSQDEFYRDGKMVMQLRTEYRMLSLSQPQTGIELTVELEKVWEPHPEKIKNLATVTFANVRIVGMKLEGGMDDFSQLEGISFVDDVAHGFIFVLELSSSGFISLKADSMQLQLGEERQK